MPDGRLKCCKECTQAYSKAFRAANQEKLREYEAKRGRTPERKAWVKAAFKKVIQRVPGKVAARHAVNNAIRDGRLVPQPCFVCGKKAEAHHADYSRPLDVTWLCFEHHRQLHTEYKEAA